VGLPPQFENGIFAHGIVRWTHLKGHLVIGAKIVDLYFCGHSVTRRI
jgi:hypothetical protein